MDEVSDQADIIVTGKTWTRYFQRTNAETGEPIPFAASDGIRAALKEFPTSTPIPVTATIYSRELALVELSQTDEQAALIPGPKRFGDVRMYWMDVDLLPENGKIWELIVSEKILVKAGVTP